MVYNWSLIKLVLLALAISKVRDEKETLAYFIHFRKLHSKHANRWQDLEYYFTSIPKSMDYLYDGSTSQGLKVSKKGKSNDINPISSD